MKYTKDNIIGIKFLGSKDPYLILDIKDTKVIMGYAEDHPTYTQNIGRTFENYLDTTLKYLNDNTWREVKQKEAIYEIY